MLGLGVRSMRASNYAFLGKLACQLIQNHKAPWVQFIFLVIIKEYQIASTPESKSKASCSCTLPDDRSGDRDPVSAAS